MVLLGLLMSILNNYDIRFFSTNIKFPLLLIFVCGKLILAYKLFSLKLFSI